MARWDIDDSVLTDMDGGDHLEDAYNLVEVSVHPLRIDSHTQILFRLEEPVKIEPDETVRLRFRYINPATEQEPIGAIEVTHSSLYRFNSRQDDRGHSLITTGQIDVVSTAGGSIEIDASLPGYGNVGWLTRFYVLGKGVYDQTPVVMTAKRNDMISRALRYDAAYQADPVAGQRIADELLARYADAQDKVPSVAINGGASGEAAEILACGEIGDVVRIRNAESAVDQLVEIRGYDMEIDPVNRIQGSITLAPVGV